MSKLIRSHLMVTGKGNCCRTRAPAVESPVPYQVQPHKPEFEHQFNYFGAVSESR